MILSIITICYNDCVGFKKTAQSVVSQSIHDFEWIVIDGGSTDGTAETIAEYTNQITYWVSEPDKGIYNAMNKGIRVAKGEYVIFLNSGDCFASCDVVEKVLPELTCDDYIMGDVVWVNENDVIQGEQDVSEILSVGRDYYYNFTTSHQGMFIRTSTLKETEYDESRKIVADWEHVIIQLLKKGGAYKTIDTLISKVLTGGVSLSNPDRMNRERRVVAEQHFPSVILDEKYLKVMHARGSEEALSQLSIFAVSLFLERKYDIKTWTDLVSPYKQVVTRYAPLRFRCINWMNFHGLSAISYIIVKLLGY